MNWLTFENTCNGVQREHNKKLNNGLPILHKVPPKRDYGDVYKRQPVTTVENFLCGDVLATFRICFFLAVDVYKRQVLLRFAQQLKLREIAQITGLPLRTVQSQIGRASCRERV